MRNLRVEKAGRVQTELSNTPVDNQPHPGCGHKGDTPFSVVLLEVVGLPASKFALSLSVAH